MRHEGQGRGGAFGEGGLIATPLIRRDSRWPADEEGAGRAVLAEPGRIGGLEAFEEALRSAPEDGIAPNERASNVGLGFVWRLRFRLSHTTQEVAEELVGTRVFSGERGTTHERRGDKDVPYVYGLTGFMVAIVLAISVLQLLR